VVVTPDNDFIINLVQPFFKELSSMYEWLRLGRHSPIDKLRDGIFRIGRKQKQKVDESFLDEWFKHIPNNHVSSNLKLYALSCKMYLGRLHASPYSITCEVCFFLASLDNKALPRLKSSSRERAYCAISRSILQMIRMCHLWF